MIKRAADASPDADGTGSAPVTDPSHEDPEAIGMVRREMDLLVAASVVVIGIALVIAAQGIRSGNVGDPIGPANFVRAMGLALVVVGMMLVIRRLVGWRRAVDHLVYADGGPADEPDHPVSTVRPFAMLVLALGWTLLLSLIGYVVSMALFCVAALWTMRCRSPIKLVAVPVVFSLATWVLFTRVSGLRFPAGPIDQLLAEIVPRLT